MNAPHSEGYIQLLVIANEDGPTGVKYTQAIRQQFEFQESRSNLSFGALKVEQCEWSEIHSVTVYDTEQGECDVEIIDPQSKSVRHVKPDFLLVLQRVTGLPSEIDHRNKLLAFMHAGVPAVNSLQSLYMSLSRPVVHGALKQLRAKINKTAAGGNDNADQFPLIRQNFYSNSHRSLHTFAPSYPLVVKVGDLHGFGKVKVIDHHGLADLSSVIALHGDHCSAEQFVNANYEIRIQKIGGHYRAYKRYISGEWKDNAVNAILEDVELTEDFKRWIDEAGTLFGGMNILAVDVIHDKEKDAYLILKVDDNAIGLSPTHLEEDLQHLARLVIHRIEQHYYSPESTVETADTSISKTQVTTVEQINEENRITILEHKLHGVERERVRLQLENEKLKTATKRLAKQIGKSRSPFHFDRVHIIIVVAVLLVSLIAMRGYLSINR